jgi:uncharacterized membrane protein YqaE (UPF0057 family)
MRYIIAIFVPPLAILLCGRWVHFVVNLILWLLSFPLLFFMGIGIFVWLLCAAYAIAICRTASMDKRVNRLVQAIETQKASQGDVRA